ncbi:MAG: TIGR02391 family protein [Planctomycetes bacterium]|nr:TIGR02391 family protein [Planctomycetota bacterium]
MALKGDLYKALLQKTGSQQTMSRWASMIDDKFGPMSPDEARLVMAHEFGIRIADYGITKDVQDRVRTLRASGASLAAVRDHRESSEPTANADRPSTTESAKAGAITGLTPAALYTNRNLHSLISQRVRKLFTSGNRAEAVSAAMKSVNNRVKRLSGLTDLDGTDLMNKAFSDKSPALRLNARSTPTEKNEHGGLRFLLAGGMLALRNPPVHEDDWQHDGDVDLTLECLGFASLLHRFLDRCEQYMAESDLS